MSVNLKTVLKSTLKNSLIYKSIASKSLQARYFPAQSNNILRRNYYTFVSCYINRHCSALKHLFIHLFIFTFLSDPKWMTSWYLSKKKLHVAGKISLLCKLVSLRVTNKIKKMFFLILTLVFAKMTITF